MNQKKHLYFHCINCGQRYTDYAMHVAVALYGIFFLAGEKEGFAGITCPQCLTTIVEKMEMPLIREVKKQLLVNYVAPGGLSKEMSNTMRLPEMPKEFKIAPNNPTGLAYNSSVVFSLDHIDGISQYDINSVKQTISSESSDTIELSLLEKLEYFPLNEYLCSYIPGIDIADGYSPQYGPRGRFFFILFCKEKDVVSLVRLEEKTGLKIFPRYYFNNMVIDTIEAFAWDNNIMLEYLRHETVELENQARLVSEVLVGCEKESEAVPSLHPALDWTATWDETEKFLQEQDPSNLYTEIEDRATDGSIDMLQHLIASEKEKNVSTKVTSDFFNCLTIDLGLKDCTLPVEQNSDLFLKVVSPFHGKEISYSPTNDLKLVAAKVQQFHAQAAELKKYTSKPYILKFLADTYESFIEEYISIARNRLFSYADLWKLQWKHQNDLFEAFEKGIRSDAEYALFREGKTWTIRFKGCSIQGLKGKGFLYIRHMLCHPRQSFYHSELAKINDVPSYGTVSRRIKGSHSEPEEMNPEKDNHTDHSGYGDEIDPSDESLTFSYHSGSNSQSENTELSADQRAKVIADWEKKIAESKARGDQRKMEKQQRELNKLIGCAGSKAKIKDPALKKVQNRIALSIVRAINGIATVGGKAEKNKTEILRAWEHFDKALANLYETSISYRPEVDIEWHF